jgi:multiple sugar transport system permease protein
MSCSRQVAIGDFAAGRAIAYGLISAVGVLTSIPPVFIAFVLQKSQTAGLAHGGLKG